MPTAVPTLNPRDWDSHPKLIEPGYKSSLLRGPTRALLPVSERLGSLRAPVYGRGIIGELDHDLTRNARRNGEPLGERIIVAGRVLDGRLKPYEDRAAIEAGALRGKGLELLWVDDPIGAFFLQIQGSGRVTLPDGKEVRVGYAGQNGHKYVAIGKELIDRGALKREDFNNDRVDAGDIGSGHSVTAIYEITPKGSGGEQIGAGEPLVVRRIGLAVAAVLRRTRAVARVPGAAGQSRPSSTLNQLAKALNAGPLPVTPETESDLVTACRDVAAMRNDLLRALGKSPGDGP